MTDVYDILMCLEKSPEIFKNLIMSVPVNMLTIIRKSGGWSIYQHACHIVTVQPMLNQRFQLFADQDMPVFQPYFPDKEDDVTGGLDQLVPADLSALFMQHRTALLEQLKIREKQFWSKKASHPEYREYTPYILLRHTLMHEHLHMYRIENLWLTNDEFL